MDLSNEDMSKVLDIFFQTTNIDETIEKLGLSPDGTVADKTRRLTYRIQGEYIAEDFAPTLSTSEEAARKQRDYALINFYRDYNNWRNERNDAETGVHNLFDGKKTRKDEANSEKTVHTQPSRQTCIMRGMEFEVFTRSNGETLYLPIHAVNFWEGHNAEIETEAKKADLGDQTTVAQATVNTGMRKQIVSLNPVLHPYALQLQKSYFFNLHPINLSYKNDNAHSFVKQNTQSLDNPNDTAVCNKNITYNFPPQRKHVVQNFKNPQPACYPALRQCSNVDPNEFTFHATAINTSSNTRNASACKFSMDQNNYHIINRDMSNSRVNYYNANKRINRRNRKHRDNVDKGEIE